MKIFFPFVFVCFCLLSISAQSQDDLLAQKAVKESELATLDPQLKEMQEKVDALKAEIAAFRREKRAKKMSTGF